MVRANALPKNRSFDAALSSQLQFSHNRVILCLKLPFQIQNPDNSLNGTVFGTARHVQQAEREGIKWRLLTARCSGPSRAAA